MNAPLPEGITRPAVGHMPFPGHRTMAQVWADEARKQILRSLGK